MGKNKQMQYDAKGAGTRLRQMRRVLGKTQAEIAALLQISLSHYSKLELGIGRMSRSMIFSVCNKFALNEKWLTDGAGTRPPTTMMSRRSTFLSSSRSVWAIILLRPAATWALGMPLFMAW